MKKTNIVVLGVASLFLLTQANSNSNLFSASSIFEIKEEYDLNSTFVVPTLEKDGVIYSSSIEFPDGETYSSSEVKLTQIGQYKVHYVGTKDGTTLKEDYTFLVHNPLFSFSGEKSFASYENSDRTYNKEGLFISLAEGETITFNTEIEVSRSKTNKLIECFVAPSSIGSIDFSELHFTFTDTLDSSNQLRARAKASIDGADAPYSYWSTAGVDQALTGYEANFNNIHVNNDFGTPVEHSFYGKYPKKNCGDAKLRIDYSGSENALYASQTVLVADYDDSKFFSNIWDGFNGDYANLTIQAKGYTGLSANFVITDLPGADLSNKYIEDVTPPTIEVNAPETIPSAKVGYSYPVFDATCKDDSGDVKLSTYVYFNYKGSNQTQLEVVDNYFKVDNEGTYTIVYEASDVFGNISKKEISVKTANVSSISVSPVGLVRTAKRGEKYYFPTYKISGGSGEIKTRFEVRKNGLLIEHNNEYFIPSETGSYSIKFIAEDITLDYSEARYSLNVTENSDPVIHDEPVLERYYVSGFSYKLPTLHAYDYSKEEVEQVETMVKIDQGNYSYSLPSGSYFVPEVQGAKEEITFTFYSGNTSVVEKAICINPYSEKVAGISRFSIESYLITSSFDITTNDNDITLTASNEGDASFEFANKLSSSSLSIQLSSNPTSPDFKGIRVTFIDSIDESKKVSLTLEKNKDGNIEFLVDSRRYASSSSFAKKANLNLGISGNRFYFNGLYAKGKYFDDGSEFSGFPSSKAYLRFEMLGASSGANISLNRIDNQSMSYSSSDYMEPRITISGDYGGSYSLNSIAKVNSISVNDVLDPNSSATVTVNDPDGNLVEDINGLTLKDVRADKEYSIKLTKYGQYIVKYVAKDTSLNQSNFIYALNVEDDEAPTLKITSEVPTSIKLGEYIKLPSYEVSDNKSSEVELTCFVTTSSGQVIYLDSYNAFKPLYEGVYTLTIRAMDEAGNIASVSYSINVTK